MHPAGEAYAQQPPQAMATAAEQVPALAYLGQLDQILVKQKKELIEVLTGWEQPNKYLVLNNMGQQIFAAKEKSGTLERQCCGPQRAFELEIHDNAGQEVIHVSRPYRCVPYHQCFSCAECCQDEITVEAPPGRQVGRVQQVYGDCRAQYQLMDVNGDVVLLIKGPDYCRCYCPGDDIPFSVLTADGTTEIGRVSRQWSNLMQEYFTDADNFGINFPIDLSIEAKATIIGACFLIDFMFFETNNQNY